MEKITLRTAQLISKYFSVDKKDLVISSLIEECGNNLPSCENNTPTDMERIHFAVIKLSNGELDKLEAAIELAKRDWRDLLVAAGFASDLNAHKEWAKTASE